MATTDRKDRTVIRFHSGSGIYLKDGATDWENIGEAISAKLTRKSNELAVTFMSGDIMKKRGSRECSVAIVLAQDNKTILDRIDALMDKTVIMAIDNGLMGTKRQCFYFKEIELIDTFDIDMSGDKHQALGISALVYPQTAVFAVTPSTGLPTECGLTGASPITGTNRFYTIVEETPA
ncbi:hypothetical protein D4R99_05255 [bacterium]|nr:MAG: hypothetical protein D4R99_05255 [bacterium]